jgi:hypothetical protein
MYKLLAIMLSFVGTGLVWRNYSNDLGVMMFGIAMIASSVYLGMSNADIGNDSENDGCLGYIMAVIVGLFISWLIIFELTF